MSNRIIKGLLKIGYKCNYKCSFCHAEFKKSLMTYPLKIFYLKILLLKKKGVKVILLTGGESTLEKHFFQIVSFIKKQGLDFGIVTNGSTIYNKAFLKKLQDLNIKYIYLSVHGYGIIHNNIVGDSNGYNKIKSIINDLKDKKDIKLFLNYVLIKDNVFSIDKTLKDLISINYNNLSIKFSLLEPEGNGNDNKLMVDPLISSNIIKECIEKYSSEINIYWDAFPLCFFDKYLENRSDLQTENIIYITEVYENKIFKTDYGNRVYIKECKNCHLRNDCYGIYSSYKNYFKDTSLINIL